MSARGMTAGSIRAAEAFERIRHGIVTAAAVVLIVGASVVGLHDWADAHLAPAGSGSATHGDAAR